MDVSEKIIKGKTLLLQKQPFYASLVLKMVLEECLTIETADVDGKTIRYNPGFIDQLDDRRVAGLLAHEVMHVALLHHTRRNRREPKKWNQACDYAINPILIKDGMKLPEGGLIDDQFDGMSAEQIYTLLPDCDENTGPGFGEVIDTAGTPTEKDQAEANARGAVAQAMLDAQMRGKLSADLERLVQEALTVKVNWREALARFVTELTQNDYSWSRPSRKTLYLRIYLPVLESPEAGSIILIADTSASIDDELLSQFACEIKGIADTFKVRLLVIYVDTSVKSTQEFEFGEDIDLKPRGGGGTDFKPGFEYIDEHDLGPRAVVYLTDGECDSYPDEPEYPVLWARFGYCSFDPPFGEKIQISD
jgi:predicted metal-dependent peptidase